MDTNDELTDPERLAEALRVLIRAFNVNERAFPSAEGRLRYNPLEFQTLTYLFFNAGAHARDIASFLGIAPTTLQSVLDRLVSARLVRKRRSQSDRRALELSLTEDGVAVVEAIRRQDRANAATMLACLSAGEQSAFVQSFSKIAGAIAVRLSEGDK